MIPKWAEIRSSAKTNAALSAKNREAICGRGAVGDMYGQIESV